MGGYLRCSKALLQADTSDNGDAYRDNVYQAFFSAVCAPGRRLLQDDVRVLMKVNHCR
jgi:hypothetical protein